MDEIFDQLIELPAFLRVNYLLNEDIMKQFL